VVVLSESLRPYLREAIASVLAQDLPRAEFELVVVKGFTDPATDAYLETIGARTVMAPGTSVGVKIALGAQHARGAIMVLLNDDDRFASTRLRAIVDAFHSHPGLGLFRNQQDFIGADGAPLERSLFRGPGVSLWSVRRPLWIEGPHRQQDLSRITTQRPEFNDSSLAIRRELVLRAVPYLLRLQGRGDTLLFFVAACSEYTVLLDPRRLTDYRVHGANTSLPGGGSAEDRARRIVSYARRMLPDYYVIREFVEQSGYPFALRFIDARIAMVRLTITAREPGSRRRDFVRLLTDLTKFWNTFPVREDLPGALGSALFVISPSLGRRLYQHRLGIR
jgi:glycosyltransferase involved in cell wall biosynthesis